MFLKSYQLCKKSIDKIIEQEYNAPVLFLSMKKLIITAICGMSLLSSCVVPNPNVQNESGFEVDTETISLMIATKLLEDDMTYEDELVRISDKLAQMTVDEVITVDELKKSIEDSIIQYCSKSRRTKVLVAFEVIFKYYGNVCGKDGYLTDDSFAAIQGISNGIARAVEIHWLTVPEVEDWK
jgi:hypothetical protein